MHRFQFSEAKYTEAIKKSMPTIWAKKSQLLQSIKALRKNEKLSVENNSSRFQLI